MQFTSDVIANVAGELRSRFAEQLADCGDSDVGDAMDRASRRPVQHRYWRQILIARYSSNRKSFKSIGSELGLSSARVAQIRDKYMRVLRYEIVVNSLKEGLDGVRTLERTVHSLEMSVRTRNTLLSWNVRTIRDLIELSRDDLSAIPNLGPTAFGDIEMGLSKIGLWVGMGADKAANVLATRTN